MNGCMSTVMARGSPLQLFTDNVYLKFEVSDDVLPVLTDAQRQIRGHLK
jgi:hypothetical protein